MLGGDGTFLRAARAVAEVDVPLLGINLGKVGFLSKAEATELEPVLERIVAGEYTIDERMVLEGRILRGGGLGEGERHIALNDIVIARGSLARVCRLDVSIDDTHLATFIADGLVVASPTGSTGYSFSAGGPILDPVSRNLVVTPIAAYLSAIRSVVVEPAPGRALPRRRRARGARLGRRSRGPADRGRRRRRGPCHGAPDPPPRTEGRAAVLGPAPPQGGAAAVVTDEAREDAPGRLLELTVVDLALIDRLRLELDAGLNVITGETGAGKSLLIDALGLALGARADTTLVRHGADTARVEALFDHMPEPLIAVREVAASGRSTARLDDSTVTAARLADEVGALVEIHGQHEQGRLLDETLATRPARRLRRPRDDAPRGRDRGGALAREPGRTRRRRASTRARSPAGSTCSSTRRTRSPGRTCGRARRTRSGRGCPPPSTARRSPGAPPHSARR